LQKRKAASFAGSLSDLASIPAFQSYMKGYVGGIIPETEVRKR
jgi:hypothetical protein